MVLLSFLSKNYIWFGNRHYWISNDNYNTKLHTRFKVRTNHCCYTIALFYLDPLNYYHYYYTIHITMTMTIKLLKSSPTQSVLKLITLIFQNNMSVRDCHIYAVCTLFSKIRYSKGVILFK